MKVYKNIFWSIISPKNLFRAWKVFKSDKQKKEDVSVFEQRLEQNVFTLFRELRNKTYKHGPYKAFLIQDPKLRRIHKATVRDRVLHHAIFNVVNPIFEPTFIPESFSCRVGKGTHKGVEKLTEILRAVSKNGTVACYALKCDIQKFFDSVDHDILLGILEKRITDSDTRWLLGEVVESYMASMPNLFERRGIPIGNLTSQIFANIYMNELDQFVKHTLKVKHYIRYTDDFVIVSSNKKYLEELIEPIQTFLTDRLKLRLHPKKVILRPYLQGIDFLGYVMFPHYRLVRKRTAKRIVRKLKHKVEMYKSGTISEDSLKQTLSSYLGVLSHADAHEFNENLLNQYWFWLKD